MEPLTWQTFKEQLQTNRSHTLQFMYAPNIMVDASYHITEIKQAAITSVDCGGVMNAWNEVIIQLWIPQHEEQVRAMAVSKALSIIALVEKSLPLNPNGIVKIEFGNAQFDTRQMLPKNFIIQGDNLVVDLRADTVQCKAIGRGESCGINDSDCCTSVADTKPLIQLKGLTSTASCTPGSGCC